MRLLLTIIALSWPVLVATGIAISQPGTATGYAVPDVGAYITFSNETVAGSCNTTEMDCPNQSIRSTPRSSTEIPETSTTFSTPEEK